MNKYTEEEYIKENNFLREVYKNIDTVPLIRGCENSCMSVPPTPDLSKEGIIIMENWDYNAMQVYIFLRSLDFKRILYFEPTEICILNCIDYGIYSKVLSTWYPNKQELESFKHNLYPDKSILYNPESKKGLVIDFMTSEKAEIKDFYYNEG